MVFTTLYSCCFVEGQGRPVVHRGFKNHELATGSTQPLFCGMKQLRSDPGLASLGQNIDGDDVTAAAASGFGNDESHISSVAGR